MAGPSDGMGWIVPDDLVSYFDGEPPIETFANSNEEFVRSYFAKIKELLYGEPK